jgi:hypothetical protein
MALVPRLALQMVKHSRRSDIIGEQQDREDGRAYAFIMKTLDASVGLDRLGWRIATQQLVVREQRLSG